MPDKSMKYNSVWLALAHKALQDSQGTKGILQPCRTTRHLQTFHTTFGDLHQSSQITKIPKPCLAISSGGNFFFEARVLCQSAANSCNWMEIPSLHKAQHIHGIIISYMQHLESSYNGDSQEDLSRHNRKQI